TPSSVPARLCLCPATRVRSFASRTTSPSSRNTLIETTGCVREGAGAGGTLVTAPRRWPAPVAYSKCRHGTHLREGKNMASCWIERRPVGDRVRYRVRYRLGGRESNPRYGGSFASMREAKNRRSWI